MIAFDHPMVLTTATIWALALVVLAWRQTPSLEWIRANIAPRFQRDLTRYTERNRLWHILFLFLTGTLAIVAAAGPFTVGAAQKTIQSRSVLLVLDASLSMGATDAAPAPDTVSYPDTVPAPQTAEPAEHRFAQARQLAAEVVAAMPDASFGLITFSGVTVVHSTPTRDHLALRSLLETLSYHVNLTLSGTRYSSAFDAVIHMVQHEEGSYQVVLLSDGELPQTDDYGEALEVLGELRVPVHTVAFGTEEGQNRVIYEPEDVINSVEDKRVAREYHTRRVDTYLEAIASQTGGESMIVANGDWVDDLVPVLQAAEPAVVEVSGQDQVDLSAYPLLGFMLGFLLETLVISRRPRRPPPPRHRTRKPGLQTSTLAVLLATTLLLLGCRPRVLQAHWHNELGVGLFETGQYPSAAARFEKSLSYKIRQHIPLYNLGKNAAAEEEFAVAHDYYQEAMLEEPRLVEAHFNDGHALYRWGEQEIDLEDCRFERAQQLFIQAAKRFRHAADSTGANSDLGRQASDDADAVDARFVELADLEANCTPPPSPPPPPPKDGEGGGEPPPPEDSPPEDGEPPPSGPSGGGEGSPETGSGSGRGLSETEQEEVRAALERIQQEAAGASGYRQSEHQQITEETVGKATGMELWW